MDYHLGMATLRLGPLAIRPGAQFIPSERHSLAFQDQCRPRPMGQDSWTPAKQKRR